MSESNQADVIVVGAGPAGLGAALGCLKAGLAPAIVDTSKSASTYASKGRSAALFNKTVAFLQGLGVWEGCKVYAEPLKALQFIDDTGRRLRAPDCVFHAEEIGETAFGYNITNADLVAAFQAEVEKQNLPIITPGPLTSFRETATKASLRFADGTELCAPLAIAADGRMSATREAAGFRKLSWAYDQVAMAASFSHERPHRGVCIEFHRSAGPFTLVPLPGNASGFVWVERKDDAERLLALDDADFARRIWLWAGFRVSASGRAFRCPPLPFASMDGRASPWWETRPTSPRRLALRGSILAFAMWKRLSVFLPRQRRRKGTLAPTICSEAIPLLAGVTS